jgi:hypothetical protein
MFTKIANAIPSITILVIITGYYDLHIYYQKFGVNISSFLDPTEIIFAFSTIFHAVITILSLSIVGAWAASITEHIQKKSNAISEKPNIIALISSHENLRKATKIGVVGILIIFIAMILTIVVFLDFLHINDFILLIGCLSILSIYWFTVKIFQIRSNLRILKSPSFTIDQFSSVKLLTKFSNYDYSFLLLVLLLYFNVRSQIRYQNVIDGFPKYAVQLEGTDQVKSKSEFYIGSTRNYIFMYDSLSKTVKSYPERDIKRIEIKEIRDGI